MPSAFTFRSGSITECGASSVTPLPKGRPSSGRSTPYPTRGFRLTSGSGSAKAPQPNVPVSVHGETTNEARTERALVLVVEDNRGDVLLVKEALAEYQVDAEVLVTLDGEQAINLIQKLNADPHARFPRVVLLDLNLPKRNGHEVLSFLRGSSKFAALHVIVFSSSNAATDREAALREGANEYICKPSSLSAFLEIGRIIGKALGQGGNTSIEPQETS